MRKESNCKVITWCHSVPLCLYVKTDHTKYWFLIASDHCSNNCAGEGTDHSDNQASYNCQWSWQKNQVPKRKGLFCYCVIAIQCQVFFESYQRLCYQWCMYSCSRKAHRWVEKHILFSAPKWLISVEQNTDQNLTQIYKV